MNENSLQIATGEVGSVRIAIMPPSQDQPYTTRNIAMHAHQSYEIYLLLSGAAIIETDQHQYTMGEQEASIIPPHLYHTIKNSTETFFLISLNFQLYKSSWPAGYEEQELLKRASMLDGHDILQMQPHPCFIDTIKRLVFTFRDIALANRYMLNAYATEFLVWLLRDAPNHSPSVFGSIATSHTYEIELERMRTIEAYFAKSYLTANIAELADILCLSEQHVRRILKKDYGMTFLSILNKHRVNVSKQLLRDTSQKITEIWQSVGFNSSQSFSVAFRKYVHCSPSEYRKESKFFSYDKFD
jgi:AraC-like DNA-binding protein/mannose-6-phosphate isomerase-like protein (cupin superfamily)